MRVTVEIPFCNNAGTLADTIRSVFAQTFQDWELILIDDGSTDCSLAIAKSVTDPRVRVIENSDNRGVAARLNQMAPLAQGEYVARMDADDVMHPDRLSQQVEYMDSHPEVDVLGTAMYTIDGRNLVSGMRGAGGMTATPADIVRTNLCHPTVMARAEWFRKNRYDELFLRSQDHELWCRTCLTSRFARLEIPTLFYRENHRNPARYLKAYLRSARFNRIIYRAYGPAILGRFATTMLIAQTYAKCATYAIATAVGLQSAMVRKIRRGVTLDDPQLAEAQSVLDETLHVHVPGLDELASGDPLSRLVQR